MSFQIENIKDIMDDLDLAALMPSLEDVLGFAALFARIAVMVGPLVVLGLGLYYFLMPPKEATYQAGYRFRWGMGSPRAWRFTQRLAGSVWMGLGLVLTIVMAILSSNFQAAAPADMLWRAVKLLLWQGGLLLCSCIAINITVFALFDLKGNRRATWKELFRA